MNTIGESIAALRKKKEMTQEALAAELGVSAQSVSKWENGTNMPDILLLPILADTFGVSIDVLYGRDSKEDGLELPDVFENCCDTVLELIGSGFYKLSKRNLSNELEQNPVSAETYIERHKAYCKYAYDGVMRSAIIQKDSILYYHHKFGGLLIRRPDKGWASLFSDEEAIKIIKLLADDRVRAVITELIDSRKTVFTISGICKKCGIEQSAELIKRLEDLNLFLTKSIIVDDGEVDIYELYNSDRLFLIFSLLACAKEYAEYQSSYYGYSGTSDYIYG